MRERTKKKINVHRASGAEFSAATCRTASFRVQSAESGRHRRLRTASPSKLWAEFCRWNVNVRRPDVYALDALQMRFRWPHLSMSLLAHALAYVSKGVTHRVTLDSTNFWAAFRHHTAELWYLKAFHIGFFERVTAFFAFDTFFFPRCWLQIILADSLNGSINRKLPRTLLMFFFPLFF